MSPNWSLRSFLLERWHPEPWHWMASFSLCRAVSPAGYPFTAGWADRGRRETWLGLPHIRDIRITMATIPTFGDGSSPPFCPWLKSLDHIIVVIILIALIMIIIGSSATPDSYTPIYLKVALLTIRTPFPFSDGLSKLESSRERLDLSSFLC